MSSISMMHSSKGHPLLPSPEPLKSRLAEATRRKARSRVERNASLRAVQLRNGLPEDARKFQDENPEAHGLPRSYKIHFDQVSSDAAASLNGGRITFGQFGRDTGAILLDGHVIQPEHIVYHDALKAYSFNAPVAHPHKQTKLATMAKQASLEDVTGYFNFNSDQPRGIIGVGGARFSVSLAPEPLMFSVDVSVNAGATWSSGDGIFKWPDADTKEWTDATWQTGTMEFGYDVATKIDPSTNNPLSRIENHFIDKLPSTPVPFDLVYDQYKRDYTSIMDGKSTPTGSLLQTTVNNLDAIPHTPVARKDNPIRSVFPSRSLFHFNTLGDSFVGAYVDKSQKNNVYAVRAQVISEWETTGIMLATLSKPSATLEKHNLTPSNISPMPSVRTASAKSPEQLKATSATATASPKLSLEALMTMSPMIADSSDPAGTGYRDAVATDAMNDFHSIIVYYMDKDLRETFISATPPLMDPAVKAIADDDPTNNRAFYQKLQTPYLAAFLGSTPASDNSQKQINVARAERMLKEIPADDPVYDRQSKKLYAMRFNKKFPAFVDYINDQQQTDYKDKINSMASAMKKDLDNEIKSLPGDPKDPQWPYKADYDRCVADITSIQTWARSQGLYWAMYLYNTVQSTTITNWYSQMTGGNLTPSIGMNLKLFNSLFSMLENGQDNPGGRNFMGAFNQAVQLFQMTSVLPQLVDASGNVTELDSIVKECLLNFIDQNKASTDPEMAARLAEATALYQDNENRMNFEMMFAEAQRLLGSMATWSNITTMYEQKAMSTGWFSKLNNGAKKMAMMGTMVSIAILALPIVMGGFDNMSGQAKTQWGLALGRLTTKVVISIIKGAIRYKSFWSDVSGFGDKFKFIMGRDAIVEKAMAQSSTRVTNSIARYFIKTKSNAQYLKEGTSMIIEEGEKLTQTESRLQKMFGRNIDELMGTIFGVIMSVTTIVLVSIDLANEKDPLMKASDVFMIASAAIQIFAIAAGWVVAYAAAAGTVFGSATAFAALELLATWGGPIGIALAVIGIIIFIVWYALQDHRSPLQKFIDDYVKPNGLYMKYLAIDYFADILPSKDTPNELVGPSIKLQTAQSKPATSPAYLHITAPAASTTIPPTAIPTLDIESSLTYSTNDIWGVDTNAAGATTFTSACYFRGTDSDGNATSSVVFYCLASKTDYSGVEMIKRPSKDDADYATALKRCQWTVTTLTEPNLLPQDPAVKDALPKPTSALVSITQGMYALTPVLDGKGQVTALTLYPNIVLGFPSTSWLLEMQPMGPGTLGYSHSPWLLLTTDTDERNPATFTPMIGSKGMTWTVTPPLPEPFELVQGGSSSDTKVLSEGAVRMKSGGKFAGPMAKTSFTVTCSLNIPGVPPIVRSATLDIQVDQAAAPADDDDF